MQKIDSYLQTIQEGHSNAIILSSFLLQYIEAGGSAREMIRDRNCEYGTTEPYKRKLDLTSKPIETVKNLFFRHLFSHLL